MRGGDPLPLRVLPLSGGRVHPDGNKPPLTPPKEGDSIRMEMEK